MSLPPPLPPHPPAGDGGPPPLPAAGPTGLSAPAGRTRRGSDPFGADDVRWQPVSPALATARRIGSGIFFAVLALPILVVAMVFDVREALVGLAVPVLGYAWSWWVTGRQVRAWGYAERPEELLLRSGVMWKRIVVVPYGRLQYVDVEAGPLARALGIATVQLHTASASSDAQVPGLPTEEAARLRDALTERGQAQLAGL